MDKDNMIKSPSISLKSIQIIMLILALLISGTLLYFTFISITTSKQLSDATDEYINMQDAARSLMDASDYLTEMAQRFTDKGDRTYMDSYFEEAFTMKRREKALETLASYPGTDAALEELQKALDESVSLMNREYYSMRLVVEAKGYTNYPKEIANVELKAEDAVLSPEEKMNLAQSMLLDEIYYSKKDRIRENMKKSQNELIHATKSNEDYVRSQLYKDMLIVRIFIFIQTVMFMLMMWITMHLGINPVLSAVKSIQADSRIPVVGAREFRYLAHAYNRMYEYYHTSIQHLNYKASHDELTKVYNRTGYEILLSSIDIRNTFYLLIDVDDFKKINDTYGHETGDKVLQNAAETIRRQFRADDYLCRIGGDEFVVLMTHCSPEHKNLVIDKIERINQDLSHSTGNLPTVTISAGVSHGSAAETTSDLFLHADEALYKTKNSGKNGYSFY